MNSQNINAINNPAIFKFEGQYLVILWFFIVICILGFLGVAIIKRGVGFGGGMFLLISVSFILFITGLLLTGRSDVVVDDQGISRCLLGKTWQTIRWENARLITAFPVSGGRSYMARGFNIYPIVKPQFSLMPSGKMVFNDKVGDAPKLVELLNYYSSKHGIRIEIRDTLLGKLTQVNRL